MVILVNEKDQTRIKGADGPIDTDGVSKTAVDAGVGAAVDLVKSADDAVVEALGTGSI